MKITRKVLIAILTLAFLVTCFAVVASANGNEPDVDDNYDAVYAAAEAAMNDETDSSEAFINAVNAAKAPLTYFALLDALNNVELYVEGANFEYPGVKEAYDEYVILSGKVRNNYQEELAAELLSYVNKHYYFNEDFSEANDDAKRTPAFSTKTYDEFKFALNGTVGAFGSKFEIINNTYGDYLNLSKITPSTFDFTPAEITSFGINFRVALTNNSSAINVILSGKNLQPLLKLANGSVSVYDAETAALVDYPSSIATSTSAEPEFFDVELLYKVEGEKATLYVVVTTDDGESTTYVSPIDNVSFTGFQITVNRACFDSMQAFESERMGKGTPEIIAKTINKLVEFYDARPDAAYANTILEAISDAVAIYGYDCTAVAASELKATTEASVLKVLDIVGNKYAQSFVNGVGAINKANAYNDRLNYVNSLTKFNDVLLAIEADYTSIVITTPAANIASAREAYAAEIAELAKAAADTKIAYDAVVVVPDFIFATYDQLYIAYNILKNHPVCATFYDDTLSADEVKRAFDLAAAIVAEYERINAKAESFVDGVLKSDNTDVTDAETPEQFRARYDAYVKAKANYYDDATYNEYLVAKYEITLEEIIALYDAVNAEMVAASTFAESFLTAVNEAKITLSYSVKLSILREWAEQRLDVELGYPGANEAMALYSAIETDVETKRNTAVAYIEAVLAIANAADKKAAIKLAKELAVNGSDVSIDVTFDDVSVTEANIILSNIEGEILVDELRDSNFIDAVAAISAAKGYEAKRQAIVNALTLQTRANASNADVQAAATALNAAIAEYNSGVNAANDSMEEAVNLATTVTAQVAPAKSMAQIVAIIKKFYE